MVLEALIQNYNSILEISLTFIGTILAIFFTLITLPIQNILGRYSQDLVKNVKEDKKLRFYFIYFLIIFGYNFLLLALPQSLILIILSTILGFISLIVFYKLVDHVFYLLDIRNQITDISKVIQIQMDSKFGNSFEVDSNAKWLENKIEVLIDVTQKAIQENRFEIVDSGLKELVMIVKKYINLNKTILSRKQQDEFLSYIYISLIDSKNLISVNSHPKIMASITKYSGDIAKETLIIDKINFDSSNIFTLLFTRLLKEIILSLEFTKETSNTPEIACNQLIDVGKVAIDSEYPHVTQNIIKDLSEVNKIAIKMPSFRGDDISYRINGKIANLLNYSIENLDKIRVNRKYVLGSMISEIDSNIKFHLEDDNPHFFDVIKILTGPVAENSISVIAHTLIWKIRDEKFESTNFEKYSGYDLLEKILDLLDHNIKLGIKMKKYLSALDLIENAYTIGIGLIKLIKDLDDTKSSEKAKKILENKVFVLLYKTISEFLKIEDSRLFNSIPIYFSLIGITFVENEDEIFSDIIDKNIAISLDLLSEIKKYNDKREKVLYSYIRLMGLWIYKWNKKSSLLDKIIEIIKIQDEELAKETTFSRALPEYGRYYPEMLINKHIETPIFPYEYNNFINTNNELFNDENRQEFEKFLKN